MTGKHDWRSLTPRIRHLLESGEAVSAADLAEQLSVVGEQLREIAEPDGSDQGDLIFEMFLLLRTLGEALAPDGDTALQLCIKRRPHTSAGGRRPHPFALTLRLHKAARIAESSAAPTIDQRIEEAMAEMAKLGSSADITHDGVKRQMARRRKEREERRASRRETL